SRIETNQSISEQEKYTLKKQFVDMVAFFLKSDDFKERPSHIAEEDWFFLLREVSVQLFIYGIGSEESRMATISNTFWFMDPCDIDPQLLHQLMQSGHE